MNRSIAGSIPSGKKFIVQTSIKHTLVYVSRVKVVWKANFGPCGLSNVIRKLLYYEVPKYDAAFHLSLIIFNNIGACKVSYNR